MKPTLGTLVVLADVTPLHHGSGDIQTLDVGQSQALGAVLLNTISDALVQKGYVVGKTVHLTAGGILAPGTTVLVVRSPDNQNRDSLPRGQAPIFLDEELARNPALTQAWQNVQGQSAPPVASTSFVLREVFWADVVVLVAVGGVVVPFNVGRAIVSGLTYTPMPVTTTAITLVFVDTRSRQVLWWHRHGGQSPPLNPQVMRNLVESVVQALP